jgi:TolB-like protein/tetratricopeptide (TPR) repeat protein
MGRSVIEEQPRPKRVVFGNFAFKPEAGDLYRGSKMVALQPQTLELLRCLLERPGEVVSRAALRTRLWPPRTVVDFDAGLNAAIKKLRGVLNDPPSRPRFIQTVPRRGYRFIGANTASDRHDSIDPLAVPPFKLAVLPFTDMSEKRDQEYMSDGIAEELLNQLAQVSELKVIARTSSFAFKGKGVDIAEIAKRLNVVYVLEGSVRKSGKKIRITAQLVRTTDSTRLWSETFDRPLDDIFAVQDEIAGAIAQALQIQLAGGESSRRRGGTRNLDAYQLYLRALGPSNQNTRSSLDAAGDYLEQAVKRDPGYGLALSSLAKVFMVKADNGFLNSTEGYGRARQLAQRALQLSPDLAEAHSMLLVAYLVLDHDWAAAEREQQRALAIDRTNPIALNAAGRLSRALGRWDEAERQLQLGLVRDPLNTYLIYNLGMTCYLAGRFVDAERMFRQLLKLEPAFLWVHRFLGKTLLAQGRPQEALAVVQQQVDEGERLKILPVLLQAVGRQAEADMALQRLIALWGDTRASLVAMTYAYRGDRDHALEWLERAYEEGDSRLVTIVGEPLLKNLADDPRYKAFLRKMKLPE